MARLGCKCGEELSNSNNPEIIYDVFSNKEWLELTERLYNERVKDINTPRLEFWKCTNCQRLYFFEEQNDTPLKIFKLEEDNDNSW